MTHKYTAIHSALDINTIIQKQFKHWWETIPPASSTTKSGRHDIAEILLKVALNTKNHHQSLHFQLRVTWFVCSMIGGEMCMSVLLKFVWWNCFPPMLKTTSHAVGNVMIDDDFWCLTLLSAIFQLYHGDQI
jgi:hypothetical protein